MGKRYCGIIDVSVNYENLFYNRDTEIEPGESLYGTIRLRIPGIAPADTYSVVVEVEIDKGGYYLTRGYCEIEVEVIP